MRVTRNDSMRMFSFSVCGGHIARCIAEYACVWKTTEAINLAVHQCVRGNLERLKSSLWLSKRCGNDRHAYTRAPAHVNVCAERLCMCRCSTVNGYNVASLMNDRHTCKLS